MRDLRQALTRSVAEECGAVRAVPSPRTIANVLLDLEKAHKANSRATFAFYAADARGDSAAAIKASDLGAEIDEHISELQDEAKALILAATGVTWDQLYEVLA